MLHAASSESRYAEVNGLRLHYLDYGSAGKPPMLCIHGGGAHGHWFDYVASAFATDYHVLALDLRGHGDSEWTEPPEYSYAKYAEDVAALVEHLGLRNFVLVGHSMGGAVSLVYTTSFPGRVAKLVVVDTRTQLSAARVAKMHEFGARPASTYATRDELIARYRLEPAGTQVAPPEVVRHMAEHSAREQPDGTWRHKFDRRVYAKFERLDGMPLWGQVKIPALIVKGELSKRIDPEMKAGVNARAPHVRFVEVAGADHHVTLDNPSGFVEAVRPFLAERT
jgi:pimeloyl-ACP methyl ester carboxylesterase